MYSRKKQTRTVGRLGRLVLVDPELLPRVGLRGVGGLCSRSFAVRDRDYTLGVEIDDEHPLVQLPDPND